LKNKSEYFNISENDIINVKATKVVGYLPMLDSSFIFQRTIGSKYLKKSESKNQPFSKYFKILKEPLVFMKGSMEFFPSSLNFKKFASLEPMQAQQIILLSSQF
jgi:hypothetical protein